MLKDFEVIRDPGRLDTGFLNNKFSKDDQVVFTDQHSVDKIFQQFARSRHDFNIFVDMSSSTYRTKPGQSTNYSHPGVLERKLARSPVINNRITIVRTATLSRYAGFNSITGWMLAHELQHSIELHQERLARADDLSRVTWDMMCKIVDVISPSCYKRVSKPYTQGIWFDNIGYERDLLFIRTACLLMTMRSARTMVINGKADIAAELLAQYIVTGKVTLNRTNLWPAGAIEQWNKIRDPAWLQNKGIDNVPVFNPTDYLNLDDEISHYEVEINRACESTLDSLVGKVIKL